MRSTPTCWRPSAPCSPSPGPRRCSERSRPSPSSASGCATASEWLMRIGRPRRAGDPVRAAPVRGDEPHPGADRRGDARGWRRGATAAGCPTFPAPARASGALGGVAWDDWRHDVTARRGSYRRKGGQPLVASLRGGALLDDAARGAGLVAVRAGRRARRWRATWSAPGWRAASNGRAMRRRDALKAGLERGASRRRCAPLRTVRLATDRGAADAKVEGPALWRRSEPGTSDDAGRGAGRRHLADGAAHAPAADLRLRGRRRSAAASTAADGATGACSSSPAAARPGSARTACTSGSPEPWRTRAIPACASTGAGSATATARIRASGAAGPTSPPPPRRFRREMPRPRPASLGFGLCDGATALALFGGEAGLDGLILVNPWLVEAEAGEPPPAAIRRALSQSGC